MLYRKNMEAEKGTMAPGVVVAEVEMVRLTTDR